MKKRVLSLLMVLTMVVSLGATALAAEDAETVPAAETVETVASEEAALEEPAAEAEEATSAEELEDVPAAVSTYLTLRIIGAWDKVTLKDQYGNSVKDCDHLYVMDDGMPYGKLYAMFEEGYGPVGYDYEGSECYYFTPSTDVTEPDTLEFQDKDQDGYVTLEVGKRPYVTLYI